MLAVAALLLVAQQIAVAPSTPPSGDTTGYWQQRIAYRIVARLDERAQAVHAEGNLWYVNASPDTLREMYFHQYLNAFRPGSRWSAADAREGRARFQHLPEADQAYERFTAVPTFDNVPVHPDYPLAPDSTVVRFPLPHPLPPGDSVHVHFAWDARPSATVYRRQGRRGREYDFAQWYPKVAVYDRLGWEENPLVPAGELYGEFGTYDVTLVLPTDQVVAATGVPVEGDPGWDRVRRWGSVDLDTKAYGDIAPDSSVVVPPGYRRVRFLARDVHHFAWTTSPDFVYEGTLYRGAIPVHVLYRPEDEAAWGHGKAVGHIVRAMQWLESIYGPYAWPQITATERIEGGATEFPMMVMYGGMSLGLVLHETGHEYSYGMLANNEWRSGWMDEGLTSYQTAWALDRTRPERARGEAPALGAAPLGYRGHAATPGMLDAASLTQYRLDLLGRAQPIGTPAQDFSEFGIYNQMVYGRASLMYGALRDAIGDSAFVRFLHDYYERWKFRHVDELAMRASAERASGRDLSWFFDEWVHHTGLIDYALRAVRVVGRDGGWVTRARVVRRGRYREPVPVGVLTSDGWVQARGDPARDDQWVEIRTAERPRGVKLDPLHLTEDWNRRNDVAPTSSGVGPAASRLVFDWPFLDQEESGRELVAVLPLAWYTTPGGVTPAVRLRTNYQGWLDRWALGVAVPTRWPAGDSRSRLQGWLTVENPSLPWVSRPLVGLRAGAWALDGVAKLALSKTWDASPYLYANGPSEHWTLGLTATLPYDTAWIDRARWTDENVVDASLEYRWHARAPRGLSARVAGLGGRAGGTTFGRAEVEGSELGFLGAARRVAAFGRLYAAASDGAPVQRAIGLSSADATELFGNDLLRGRGAPFARSDAHYVALGGAKLRGYSSLLRVRSAAAANTDWSVALARPPRRSVLPAPWLGAFADAAWATPDSAGARAHLFADAGLALVLRGRLYDQPYTVRFDVPLWVRAAGVPRSGRLRWGVGLGAMW